MTRIAHAPGRWLDPADGAEIAHAELMRRMAKQRVVLLGETHDRFDIHRWQLHVAVSLLTLTGNIAIGFEMFPRRVQPVLDEWVAGVLDTGAFLEKVEWQTVWNMAPELYLPIFHFCRQFKVPMRALNCRRALVTEVGKLGWNAIPEQERDGLTPSRPAGDDYRRYLFDLTGGARPDRQAMSSDDPAFDRFVRAQQTWDRAFACNIQETLDTPAAPLVVGIIGRGHLEYGYGTPWQLEDLGVGRVSVLLPSDDTALDIGRNNGIAAGIFRLDSSDRWER